MKRYIGIDLGTTNSVICSFDGVQTRIWKSPDQSDVTPSAIYVDKHGHRYYGRRAYESAPSDDQNAATLFKRYLGTDKKFSFAATGEELTPEECSAEILRVLFGYLPDEWQQDPETATVITVPAAFNQMKKDATLQAADLARIGRVAVMQEPVAAVMSTMKDEPIDGIFIVYDLGGGTFDISVAEHLCGQVNLLAQGGKEMCGGRDWDRLIWREIALPWLRQQFNLPPDVEKSAQYRRLRQLSLYACEQAKIELSSRDDAYIQMDEYRIAQKDLDGEEIYLDIPLTRDQLTSLVEHLLTLTVDITRETIQKAGVQLEDVYKIVFIGGPTVYPPLQRYVMNALGISHKGLSNPMTAVAEGASIFAESIDWSSSLHERKEIYHRALEADFEINHESRVSADTASIALVRRNGKDFSAEVVSESDGWTSGRVAFRGRGIIHVPLRGEGANAFRLSLFDDQGQPVALDNSQIIVERVFATITAIPSSHSILLKALDRMGGKPVPVFLIKENEHLPHRGSALLKAGKRLVSGSSQALTFTLWEGEIIDPIEDNRYIGTYRIQGTSFSSGVIEQGADIICDYEVSESGQLRLGATVPSVRAVFESKNFYSRFEGQLSLSDPSGLLASANHLQSRIEELQSASFSMELEAISQRLGELCRALQEDDPEAIQQAANDLLDCQRDLARFRHEHLKEFQIAELRRYAFAKNDYRDEMSDEDAANLDKLYANARRTIEYHCEDFETALSQYRRASFQALQGCDRYLKDQFQYRVDKPEDYEDQKRFRKLKAEGQSHIANGEFGKLRGVISQLDSICKEREPVDFENMYAEVNVLRG